MREVELFGGADVTVAQKAFTKLAREIERRLSKNLHSLLKSESDREDAISSTLAKLWDKRISVRFLVEGAWWSYVWTVAYRYALSILRQRPFDELDDEFLAIDLESIKIFTGYGEDRDALYRYADELWLGIDPGLVEQRRRRQLFAAQLFYLEEQSITEILAILGEDGLTRKELDDWFSDESTLRDVSFHELYLDNDALARHLLGIDFDLSVAEITSLSDRISPPNGWTWTEVKIILLRYRNGLVREKVLQLSPEMSQEAIDAIIQKCIELLPFALRAEKLRATFDKYKVSSKANNSHGFWKRMSFGYKVACDLPYKHISERLDPAAEVLGFKLTDPMLNAWYGNGRVYDELAKYVRERHGN